jgi:hypothetical protein
VIGPLGLSMGMGMVRVEVQIAIVLLTLCGRAEDCVGFGYFNKAFGGVWVGAVAVWVVGFGEGVKGPGGGGC